MASFTTARFSDLTRELPTLFGIWQLPVALIACTSYLICLGLYRIYFSPLAKFPGPRLAALTTWYQGYYQVWRRGHYVWIIKEMHEQYGPIVRINPYEIHINDPDYIDEVYAGSSKRRDKYRWISRLTIPNSFVTTVHHELHRKRRAALNNFFSKASIRRLEPMIRDSIGQLLNRMEICGRSGEVMTMNIVYKALTSDIITKYSFGKSSNYVVREDFNRDFFEAFDRAFEYLQPSLQMGWLSPFIRNMPAAVTIRLMPALRPMFERRLEWKDQIEEIKRSKGSKIGRDNLFYDLVYSDELPESEKATLRLQQEAEVVVQGGQDTTAQTLSALTYHLLANPDKLSKLKRELADAIPDPTIPPTCQQVEGLPYFTAVIHETLRLNPGFILRSQRVSPDEPLRYDDGKNPTWVIPAGTPVSMSIPLIQSNPDIFPEPRVFRPERWLENPRLDRYLFAFSKGTRMCLGINLAYQELYLVAAAVFRRYDVYDGTGLQKGPTLALYETTRERDVDMLSDLSIPFPVRGSKGMRILVKP